MVKKILFVCLGNICRSPAAEGIFNQKIKERDLEKLFLLILQVLVVGMSETFLIEECVQQHYLGVLN